MKIMQECIFYLLIFQLFTTAHFLQLFPVYMQSDHELIRDLENAFFTANLLFNER